MLYLLRLRNIKANLFFNVDIFISQLNVYGLLINIY